MGMKRGSVIFADLNSDDKVNATDIQLIIRWILGIDQRNLTEVFINKSQHI